MLSRPERVSSEARTGNAAAASEVSRFLVQSDATGEVVEPDRAYIASIVSSRIGLNEADARARVDIVLGQIEARCRPKNRPIPPVRLQQ